MDMNVLIDLIGWGGALAVLLAYGLISNNRVQGNSVGYQLLNFAGGIFLLINTIYYGAFPSAFVNVVWIGIAVAAMIKIMGKAKGAHK